MGEEFAVLGIAAVAGFIPGVAEDVAGALYTDVGVVVDLLELGGFLGGQRRVFILDDGLAVDVVEGDFHALHGGEGFLIHNDGSGAFQVSVRAARVGGQLGHPFVVQVLTGADTVIGRGVALADFDGLTVDLDIGDVDEISVEGLFAVHNAHGAEGQALGFFSEFQADGVGSGAGDFRVRGGDTFRSVPAPVLIGPGSVRVHQVSGIGDGHQGEVHLELRNTGEEFLIHNDRLRVFHGAVKGMGIFRQLADPFVVDVHAGGDFVIGRGIALGEFDRLSVDPDRVDLQESAGEGKLAVGQSQRGEGQAFGRGGKFQGNRVITGFGDFHIRRGDAFGSGAAPVLVCPGGIRVHDIGGGAVEDEVRFHALHRGKGFLIHNDGSRIRQAAVKGAGIGGELADPFIVDVHAGDLSVVRRSIPLFDLDFFPVDADGLQLDGVARQVHFAVVDADGCKCQALGLFGELQADGIRTGAADLHIGRSDAFRGIPAPVLIGPACVGIHQVRDRACRDSFLGRGKSNAADGQYQRQNQRQNG